MDSIVKQLKVLNSALSFTGVNSTTAGSPVKEATNFQTIDATKGNKSALDLKPKIFVNNH
jgi:hypothetical protein